MGTGRGAGMGTGLRTGAVVGLGTGMGLGIGAGTSLGTGTRLGTGMGMGMRSGKETEMRMGTRMGTQVGMETDTGAGTGPGTAPQRLPARAGATYAFELDVPEDLGQQEAPQGHGEDEDEGQRQRGLGGLHRPQHHQGHDLGEGEDVHPPSLHLRDEEPGGVRLVGPAPRTPSWVQGAGGDRTGDAEPSEGPHRRRRLLGEPQAIAGSTAAAARAPHGQPAR